MFIRLFLLICFSGFSQSFLNGLVVDAATQNPLPGATVFISNSTYQTLADDNGYFTIQIPEGGYQLAVTYLGYYPIVLAQSNFLPGAKRYVIPLEIETNELQNVTILPDQKRREYLELFRQNFLGSSSNAQGARILNMEVININIGDHGEIEISASAPLEIEIPELGYHVTFLLTGFSLDFKKKISAYSGYPTYRELIPDKPTARSKKRRRETYYGSMMHFIRAAFYNKTRSEGFVVNQYRIDDNQHVNRMRQNLSEQDYLTQQDDRLFMAFDHYLEIRYTRSNPDPRYHSHLRGQYSSIKAEGPDIEIFANGNYSNTNQLVFYGYQGWKRMADQLPFDYQPE
jgi:hypothetical protein